MPDLSGIAGTGPFASPLVRSRDVEADTAPNPGSNVSTHLYLTAPNLFTLARLRCLPLFVYLLFGRDNLAGAGWLLGGLGATDWVDGWLARRYNQVSEFGKMFDPIADRILFIVGIGGIIIKGAAPLWFCWAAVAREVLFGGTVVVATLAFKMKRFDVTWWGKTATFLLMFAFPGFLVGASDLGVHRGFEIAAWCVGIPGLALSYYTAITYIPTIRTSIRAGRKGTP
jgi:cardiolipin synthase